MAYPRPIVIESAAVGTRRGGPGDTSRSEITWPSFASTRDPKASLTSRKIHPPFESRGDRSESAELISGSGITIRRFEASRSNPWHHAPGRAAVFTLSGAVDIEIGDGTVRRFGPGDILIAEDLTGQGHVTREIGPESRVSIFVPLPG
jgi:quercetin dioxygenase-like cupin family protein